MQKTFITFITVGRVESRTKTSLTWWSEGLCHICDIIPLTGAVNSPRTAAAGLRREMKGGKKKVCDTNVTPVCICVWRQVVPEHTGVAYHPSSAVLI